MTIDEKIKQAAEAFGNKRARMQCSSGCEHTDKVWQRHLKVGAEDGFIAGTEAMRSEMLADMQKLAEALEFYQKHADCNSGVIYGNCRCSFCKRDEEFKRTFAEFNAKYKGQK